MPYYYFISEVTEEPSGPVYGRRGYKKPDTYNLVLPSIHASRRDNVLDTSGDSYVGRAVDRLLADCPDAHQWPSTSYTYINKDEAHVIIGADKRQVEIDQREPVSLSVREVLPAENKPPGSSYHAVEPHVIVTARNLFFERCRQQITNLNPYNTPVSGAPSDYELFAIWASLTKSEQMSYICEVNNELVANLNPRNCVETQRAVSALYSSSPDSHSWPSLQFIRSQSSTPAMTTAIPPSYSVIMNTMLPYKFDNL